VGCKCGYKCKENTKSVGQSIGLPIYQSGKIQKVQVVNTLMSDKEKKGELFL